MKLKPSIFQESQEDSPMSIVKSTSPMSIGSFSGNEVVRVLLSQTCQFCVFLVCLLLFFSLPVVLL